VTSFVRGYSLTDPRNPSVTECKFYCHAMCASCRVVDGVTVTEQSSSYTKLKISSRNLKPELFTQNGKFFRPGSGSVVSLPLL